jgi:large subunit ribosomal protein L30
MSDSKKTITLRQVASGAGRKAEQRATLKGLGLDKLNRTRTLEDTPEVRGMITRVRHLIEIIDDVPRTSP